MTLPIKYTSPTILTLDYNWVTKNNTELKKLLTYEDKKIQFQIQKLKNSSWYNPEKSLEKIEELKKQRFTSLLLQDKQGDYYTYSGLLDIICNHFHLTKAFPEFEYPKPQIIPWANKDARSPYPYQTLSKEKLLNIKHGGIELPTGSGKSKVILDITKEIGLKTVIVTPSVNIAEQLYNEFSFHLGIKYVGKFFGGKKESSKKIVIGVIASLAKVSEEDSHFENFKKTQVLIVDETHLAPTNTLSKVCLKLLGASPYRFFVSATQFRQDGLDLLLKAITGPIVYEMSFREAVDQGYLSKPSFVFIKTTSSSNYSSKDVNKMTQKHLYQNKKIAQISGEIADKYVSKGKQILILIDEIEQFQLLRQQISPSARVGFAHGTLTVENKKFVPPDYHDSDTTDLVKNFNEGKLDVLIGTSCISTGTDIKANNATVYLVGNKSEIAVMQGAVGRSCRLHKPTDKTSVDIFDFSIENINALKRHAKVRKEIYESVYGNVKEISI